ncbi:MAG TPA: hypothetical protein PLK30_23630 [Blastocatellia bacterium]|nr:hypothetical protein [Blastocatellia bacterium]
MKYLTVVLWGIALVVIGPSSSLFFVKAQGIPWDFWRSLGKAGSRMGPPHIRQTSPSQFAAFAINRDDGALWRREQTEPERWGEWRRIGKPDTDQLQESVVVTNHQDGRLIIFVAGQQAVWMITQASNGKWLAWKSVYSRPVLSLTTATTEDGRIGLLVLNMTQGIESVLQTAINTNNWDAPALIIDGRDRITSFQVLKLGTNPLEIYALADGAEILQYSTARYGSGGVWRKNDSIRLINAPPEVLTTNPKKTSSPRKYSFITFPHEGGYHLLALTSNGKEVDWFVRRYSIQNNSFRWSFRQSIELPAIPGGPSSNRFTSILAAKEWDGRMSIYSTDQNGVTRYFKETYPDNVQGQWNTLDDISRISSLQKAVSYTDGRTILFGQAVDSSDLMFASQRIAPPKLIVKIKQIKRDPQGAETIEMHELQTGQRDKMVSISPNDSFQVEVEGVWVRNLKVYVGYAQTELCNPPVNPDSNTGSNSYLTVAPQPKLPPVLFRVSRLIEPCPNGRAIPRTVYIRVTGESLAGEIVAPQLRGSVTL